MKQPRWIACPECGDVIGEYNETVEKNRDKQDFKSWCSMCKKGVKPLYLR